MSIYLVEANKASGRVSGCECHDRVPRYPSDMTDAQWTLLRPEAQAVMAELRRSPAGRPMEHDLRAVLDAIGYVTRYGIEWRALPVDFLSVTWNQAKRMIKSGRVSPVIEERCGHRRAGR
jgi:transposase